jgi:hypothetical protein
LKAFFRLFLAVTGKLFQGRNRKTCYWWFPEFTPKMASGVKIGVKKGRCKIARLPSFSGSMNESVLAHASVRDPLPAGTVIRCKLVEAMPMVVTNSRAGTRQMRHLTGTARIVSNVVPTQGRPGFYDIMAIVQTDTTPPVGVLNWVIEGWLMAG